MSNIGFVYLYDVNGRRLFIESKESLFHESVVYAVSPYFVAALGTTFIRRVGQIKKAFQVLT